MSYNVKYFSNIRVRVCVCVRRAYVTFRVCNNVFARSTCEKKARAARKVKLAIFSDKSENVDLEQGGPREWKTHSAHK